MKKSIGLAVVFTALQIVFAVNAFAADSKNLFKIERSKNANIVQYDIVFDDNGKIDLKKPMDAYWLLYAKDGSREELSAFDKKAYGFKIKYNELGYYDLSLKAVDDRNIKVMMVEGEPKAEISISERPAYLSKVYVNAIERWTGIPKVTYYTLTGTDTETGEDISERIDVK